MDCFSACVGSSPPNPATRTSCQPEIPIPPCYPSLVGSKDDFPESNLLLVQPGLLVYGKHGPFGSFAFTLTP